MTEFWSYIFLLTSSPPSSFDFDFNFSKFPREHPTVHQEIRARLKWAAKATDPEAANDEGSVTTSDTVRYALFLVAGLISVAQSQALEAWVLKMVDVGDLMMMMMLLLLVVMVVMVLVVVVVVVALTMM